MLALVGDTRITTDEFLARLREQPEAIRHRYSPVERRRELLDSMVRQELLLQEAERQKLDQDPSVRAVTERMMVQQLIQKASAQGASEEQERAFYESHSAEFNRPERIRVAHLLLPKESKETARVLSRLRALKDPALGSAFAEEVRKASLDTASKFADGDLGLLTRDELIARWGPEVSSAAFALKAIGDVSPAVEDDRGVHLLKLGGRLPGVTTSFAEARGRIAARLAAESRAKALDTLVAALRSQTKVEVREAALASLPLEGLPAATPPPDAG